MYCFPLIKLVLDDLYAQIPLSSDNEKIKAIRRALELLTEKYQMLCRGGFIDYNNPVTRFAYTYCYVASHADVMYQLINDNYIIQKILRTNEIKVACLGGGPGSDLLGILKYMRLDNISTKLICNIFDREELWQPCIASIANNATVFAGHLGVEPTVYGTVFYRELDIAKNIEEGMYDEICDTNVCTAPIRLDAKRAVVSESPIDLNAGAAIGFQTLWE